MTKKKKSSQASKGGEQSHSKRTWQIVAAVSVLILGSVFVMHSEALLESKQSTPSASDGIAYKANRRASDAEIEQLKAQLEAKDGQLAAKDAVTKYLKGKIAQSAAHFF